MSIRVLIVDDHAVVRSGLRLLLNAEKDLEPVGEAGSARDAVFQARALKPDVILLDVVMPEQTGLDVLPQLKHENPDAKVLLSIRDADAWERSMRERLALIDGRLEIESRPGAGTTLVAEVPVG